MPKEEKVRKKEEIKELLKDARGIYFFDFTGYSVPEITELRQRLKQKGARMMVVRNTLTRKALSELGKKEIEEFLVGPNAIVVTYKEELDSVKTLFDFSQEIEKGEIKGGWFAGKTLEKEEVIRLAKLPSVETLRARTVSALKSPLIVLLFYLKGLTNSLVLTLDAIRRKKEEGS